MSNCWSIHQPSSVNCQPFFHQSKKHTSKSPLKRRLFWLFSINRPPSTILPSTLLYPPSTSPSTVLRQPSTIFFYQPSSILPQLLPQPSYKLIISLNLIVCLRETSTSWPPLRYIFKLPLNHGSIRSTHFRLMICCLLALKNTLSSSLDSR